jgi:hypothetical protein
VEHVTAKDLKELAATCRHLAEWDPRVAEAMIRLARQYETEIAEMQRARLDAQAEKRARPRVVTRAPLGYC